MIATIAPRIDSSATRTVDVGGLIVAPGFIDLHVHAFQGAAPLPSVLPIVEVPTADNYVRQGVTTLITGPDGFSPVRLRLVFDQLPTMGISPNVARSLGTDRSEKPRWGASIGRPHPRNWSGCAAWSVTACAPVRSG